MSSACLWAIAVCKRGVQTAYLVLTLLEEHGAMVVLIVILHCSWVEWCCLLCCLGCMIGWFGK